MTEYDTTFGGMSSYGGISSNSWSWISRAFWIGLSAFWIYSLAGAMAAKRAGVPDSYHNQYSRQIALASAELLIAGVFLVLGTPRVRGQWRYGIVAAMFGGMAISLVAASWLAR